MNQVKPSMNMRCSLLGYSFEPRPNSSRALGKASFLLLTQEIKRRLCS